MIIRIFSSGTSNGQSPVRYLLGQIDHSGESRSVSPEVLSGNPNTTIAVINSIQRKHKYVSGAIAFRDSEKPSPRQIREIIQEFKEVVCPGLDSQHYNSLFVRHEDKGNTEIHFVFPSLEFTTGNRLSIHPPGARNIALYEAFTKVMNEKLGYDQVHPDPLKLALSDFERRTIEGREDRSNKFFLHKRLVSGIRKGEIKDRDELCHFLTNEFGLEVTRRGTDYISVKFDADGKARRLRGPLYVEGGDYAEFLRLSTQPPPSRLSAVEYEKQQMRLRELVAERAELFAQAYLQPKKLRSSPVRHPIGRRGNRDADSSFKENYNNKEKPNMKGNSITDKAPQANVSAVVRGGRGFIESAVKLVPSVTTALGNIKRMREDGSVRLTSKEVAPIASSSTVWEVSNSLASLEGEINAAIADCNAARNPEQAKAAGQRLYKLQEQKKRLIGQLEKAKSEQAKKTLR